MPKKGSKKYCLVALNQQRMCAVANKQLSKPIHKRVTKKAFCRKNYNPVVFSAIKKPPIGFP
jgi:hypothetical protein